MSAWAMNGGGERETRCLVAGRASPLSFRTRIDGYLVILVTLFIIQSDILQYPATSDGVTCECACLVSGCPRALALDTGEVTARSCITHSTSEKRHKSLACSKTTEFKSCSSCCERALLGRHLQTYASVGGINMSLEKTFIAGARQIK